MAAYAPYEFAKRYGYVDLNNRANYSNSALPYTYLGNGFITNNPLYNGGTGSSMPANFNYYNQQQMYGQQQFGYGYNQSAYPTNQMYPNGPQMYGQPMFGPQMYGYGSNPYAYSPNYATQNTATTTTQGAPSAPVERTYGSELEKKYAEYLVANDKVSAILQANNIKDLNGDGTLNKADLDIALNESKDQKSWLFFKTRETKNLENLESQIQAALDEQKSLIAAINKENPNQLTLMNDREARKKQYTIQQDNAQFNTAEFMNEIKLANTASTAEERAAHWQKALTLASSKGADGLPKDANNNIRVNLADLDTKIPLAVRQQLVNGNLSAEQFAQAVSKAYADQSVGAAYTPTSTGTGTNTQTLLADQAVDTNLLQTLSASLGVNSFDANGDGKTTNTELVAKLNESGTQNRLTNDAYLKAILEANNITTNGQTFAVKGVTQDAVVAQTNVGTSQTAGQGASIV